jgi:hypothetical protein
MRKAAELNKAKERGVAVKCSELERSNHRGCARREVCNYALYDLNKNVSEFTCPNGGATGTVFAISKKRQPPTIFFNGQHRAAYRTYLHVDLPGEQSFQIAFDACIC